MMDYDKKKEKKLAKARVKIAAARAKAQAKSARAETQGSSDAGKRGSGPHMPGGVGVSIKKTPDGSQLVVTGLSDGQLERLLPQVNREILITLTEETSTLRASMMRFVREGLFQTVVKVIAGLIVGFLLVRFGLA